MKRILFLLGLALCVVALTSFNIVAADKVLVCHNNPDMDDDPTLEWFVISVAASAVPAHIAHGDCLAPVEAVVGEACTCIAGQ